MPSSASVPADLFLRRIPLGLALMVLGAAAGCQTTTEVKVDSLAKADAASAVSYQIKNKNPLVADDSLRHKEAAGFVKTALSGRGLYEAPPGVKPDLIVELDYGVGPPQVRRETVSEPVYVNVPGQVRTQTVQVGVDSQGRPIYQTVMVQDPPSQQLAGYRDYQITYVVYEKYLRLTARQNAEGVEGRPPAEVWTIDATSEGETRDLRKTLPILVAASIDFVGKDSKGQKTVRLQDADKDVAFVKRGM